MTSNTVKHLVSRLRGVAEGKPATPSNQVVAREAADTIESLVAEVEDLKAELELVSEHAVEDEPVVERQPKPRGRGRAKSASEEPPAEGDDA